MQNKSDAQLLGEYASKGSEPAFAEIVARHTDLVYSSALRQTGSPELAREITQSVFTDLARKARALTGTLSSDASLAGWLFRGTRFAGLKLLRDDHRRQTRERQFMEHFNPAPETVPDWERVAPVLDEAMAELGDADHEAVLLRYFKNQDFRAVGLALGVSDAAAQRRVSRAVEHLREFFSKRGVSVGASGLAVVLSANAVQAAPVGLAVSISTIAIAGTAGSGLTALTILNIMSMTKLKIGIITAVVAAGIAIPVVVRHQAQTKSNAANESLRQQTEQADQLAVENEDLAKGATTASAPTASPNGPSPELLRLRGEVGRLRRESAESKVPITRDQVESRYKNAQELARSGNPAEALKEFLWCFDEGMPGVASYAGVRTSFLLNSIAKLGEEYPAALTALRERRDKASQRMLNSEKDSDAAMDFAALNRTLKEDQNTLAFFDQLPAEDPRRQTLASAAYDQLVDAQRYGDALLGRPYANISALFEMGKAERPLPASIANPEEIRKSQRNHLINSTAKSIEMLAGAGDLVHARALAGRLLECDNTPETKALLQQHISRAGQAGLLEGLTNP